MIKNIITSSVTALVVALIVFGLVGGHQSVPLIKGVTNYDTIQVSGFKLGSTTNATNYSFMGSGTCNLTGMDALQNASTTIPYSCSAPGVRSGDIVIMPYISTSTSMFSSGWAIVGAKASTTIDAIDVVISNLTGTARIPSVSGVGSSTPYMYYRTQSTNQGL